MTTAKDPAFKYRRGNKKLGPDTLILNMGSATDCPSRRRIDKETGKSLRKIAAAGKKCYALKPEEFRKSCLPFRREQEKQWKARSAKYIADQLIGVVDRAKNKNIEFLRFSEAGDFRSVSDLRKMDEIACRLKERDITTYGYTARKDLNLAHKCLVLNCSGFVKKGCDNTFVAVPRLERFEGRSPTVLACSADCRNCKNCKVATRMGIQAKYH
jgi:hypothetical protein